MAAVARARALPPAVVTVSLSKLRGRQPELERLGARELRVGERAGRAEMCERREPVRDGRRPPPAVRCGRCGRRRRRRRREVDDDAARGAGRRPAGAGRAERRRPGARDDHGGEATAVRGQGADAAVAAAEADGGPRREVRRREHGHGALRVEGARHGDRVAHRRDGVDDGDAARQRVDPRRRGHAPLTVVPRDERRRVRGASGAAAAAAPPPTSSPAGMRPPPKPVSRVSARPTYPSLARAFMSSARASSRVSRPASATQTKAAFATARATPRHGVGMTVSGSDPLSPDGEAARAGDCERDPPESQARARPAPPTEKCATGAKLSSSRTSTTVPAQRAMREFAAAPASPRDQHRPRRGEARAGLPRRHDAPAAGPVAREAPPRARVAPRRHDEHLISREITRGDCCLRRCFHQHRARPAVEVHELDAVGRPRDGQAAVRRHVAVARHVGDVAEFLRSICGCLLDDGRCWRARRLAQLLVYLRDRCVDVLGGCEEVCEVHCFGLSMSKSAWV